MNFNGKIDLTKIMGAVVKVDANGKHWIGICAEDSLFYSSNTGAAYLDIQCRETPNSQYSSHMIQQSLGKDAYSAWKEKHPNEYLPSIGSLKAVAVQQATGVNAPIQPQVQNLANAVGAVPQVQPTDECPF